MEGNNDEDGPTRYSLELTDRELQRVLVALTVYANHQNEPIEPAGETRQIRQMISDTVELVDEQ